MSPPQEGAKSNVVVFSEDKHIILNHSSQDISSSPFTSFVALDALKRFHTNHQVLLLATSAATAKREKTTVLPLVLQVGGSEVQLNLISQGQYDLKSAQKR